LEAKERFLVEQREWDREVKKMRKEEEKVKVEGDHGIEVEGEGGDELLVKEEDGEEVDAKTQFEGETRRNPKRVTRTRVKKEIKEEDVHD